MTGGGVFAKRDFADEFGLHPVSVVVGERFAGRKRVQLRVELLALRAAETGTDASDRRQHAVAILREDQSSRRRSAFERDRLPADHDEVAGAPRAHLDPVGRSAALIVARRALADDAFDAEALRSGERRATLLVDVLRVPHRSDGRQHVFEQLFALHEFEPAQVELQCLDEVECVQRRGLMARSGDDLRRLDRAARACSAEKLGRPVASCTTSSPSISSCSYGNSFTACAMSGN